MSSSLHTESSANALSCGATDGLLRHLESYGTCGDLRGFTEAELSAVYAVGFHHYRQGRYREAHDIFAFLIKQNHLERSYMLALAGAFQMLGQYRSAVHYYGVALTLDIEEPSPLVAMAECLISLGMPEPARTCLEAVLTCRPADSEPDAPRMRARALIQLLTSSQEGSSP
ncbi:CesD/SycD/LcrH family type III secretion system chaperone [Pandoraea iniqua]|uniref:CesD/SycD/LcrH family type III secretion system chaperone n=1 Tax=Pandoraea iniqua TaxID=2508288 RepID=A0A5E4YI38_9BURK|nr:SycD/LcrH family type III secretion system chaperone [Pandoraea iniqua]VVE48429.1 CesD/SycD/LcrH family type III secretion system chaperone [Pandoraea iniqua]